MNCNRDNCNRIANIYYISIEHNIIINVEWFLIDNCFYCYSCIFLYEYLKKIKLIDAQNRTQNHVLHTVNVYNMNVVIENNMEF